MSNMKAAHLPIEYFYEITFTCLVTKDMEGAMDHIASRENNSKNTYLHTTPATLLRDEIIVLRSYRE